MMRDKKKHKDNGISTELQNILDSIQGPKKVKPEVKKSQNRYNNQNNHYKNKDLTLS